MAQYQICQIVWINTSPYGGYVANDLIKVYWDTSINGFVVNKNGSVVTSGNDIPYTFIYNNLPDTSYKREGIYQTIICNGTSLVKYDRISSFPYFSSTLLPNHASCTIGGGVVCDIQWNSIPIITNASSISANDGSVSVDAYSPNGTPEYNINSDFVYGSGQTSGTFSGLSPGNYTIYARESINCRATITITIGYDKTYGDRYNLEFVSPTGQIHNTIIKQKDYLGSVTDVNADSNPIIYRMRTESNFDKFNSVFPSEIEANFISESNFFFQDIFTSDPDKFLLIHKIDNLIVWQGKVLINQYQENYVSPPYPISIIATDGLANLDKIQFLDYYGLPFSGKYKQIEILAYILKKTGINLNIRSGANLLPTSSVIATYDPFDLGYVDTERYYLLGNSPNCLEVLRYILEPYCANIKQWNNCWYITRLEENIDVYNYREFDSDGQYLSNSFESPVLDVKLSTDSNRLVWAEKNQTMRIMPGFGKAKLIYDLGSRENILLNGDFRLTSKLNYDLAIGDSSVDVVPDLTNWQIIVGETGTSVDVDYEQLDGTNISVNFASSSESAANSLLSKTYNLKTGNNDLLKFSIRFKILSDELTITPAFGYAVRYIKVKLIIKYGDYYLADDGTWTTSVNLITYYVGQENINKFVEYQLTTSQPSSDYINGADFNVQIFFPHINDIENKSTSISDALNSLRNLPTIGRPNKVKTEVEDYVGTYHPIAPGLGLRCALYYELVEDNNSEEIADLIQPSDYSVGVNEKKWSLVDYRNYQPNISNTISIDYIRLSVLYDGKEIPATSYSDITMETLNNEIITKNIVHGTAIDVGQTIINRPNQPKNPFLDLSILYNNIIPGLQQNYLQNYFNSIGLTGLIDFVATSAELIYTGYVRDSNGTPYNNWYKAGSIYPYSIQQLFLESYTSQYNQPWRFINGTLYSNDIILSPINSIKETMDNNTIYIPSSLEINFYRNTYSCELMEIFDYTTNNSSSFSLGFSLGFKA